MPADTINHEPALIAVRPAPWRDPRRENARLAATVLGLSALAWLATFVSHAAVEGNWHGPLTRTSEWPDFAAFVCTSAPSASAPMAEKLQWLAGWALMVLAMMLPPALPFLRAMSQVGAERRGAVVTTAAAVFVLAWTAVGLALLLAGTALGWLAQAWPALAARPALISGMAALAAGAFQFTPLKKACLTACRRPDGLILMAWRSDAPLRAAAHIGARYAAVCIGCCAALMLLTLAVGAFALPLMVVVSVAMLFERLLPSVRTLVALQAALAILIGLLLLSGLLPAGLGFVPVAQPMVPATGLV